MSIERKPPRLDLRTKALHQELRKANNRPHGVLCLATVKPVAAMEGGGRCLIRRKSNAKKSSGELSRLLISAGGGRCDLYINHTRSSCPSAAQWLQKKWKLPWFIWKPAPCGCGSNGSSRCSTAKKDTGGPGHNRIRSYVSMCPLPPRSSDVGKPLKF